MNEVATLTNRFHDQINKLSSEGKKLPGILFWSWKGGRVRHM